VPSPPSPNGINTVSAFGNAFLTPFSIELAASIAVTLPLNESGAIIILIMFSSSGVSAYRISYL